MQPEGQNQNATESRVTLWIALQNVQIAEKGSMHFGLFTLFQQEVVA